MFRTGIGLCVFMKTSVVNIGTDDQRRATAAVDNRRDTFAGVAAAVKVEAAFVRMFASSEGSRNFRRIEPRILLDFRNSGMKTSAAFYKFLLIIFSHSLCLYNGIFKNFALFCMKPSPYMYDSISI